MNKIKLKPQGKIKSLIELQRRELEKQIIKIHGGQNEQFISLISPRKEKRGK